MWNTVIAVNSFIVIPAVSIFFIYACGRALLYLEWKVALVALIVLVVTIIAEHVLALIDA